MRMTLRIALLAVFTTSLFAAPARFKPYEFKAQDGTVVAAEAGEFDVPENRSKAGSRTITIKFIRFKSTTAKPGAPIVYLAGGPGGSGMGAAMTGRFKLFMALREFGDVIAYDQRGTHESGPDMLCSEEYRVELGKAMDRASAGAVLAESVRRCADRLRASGVDLAGYNTTQNAADLNDLRLALGAPKLVLWGISYGTHLAIATLRNHPEAVERAILAGIEGPDDTYKLPSDQQSLLEEIARIAAREDKSRDLLASINKLMRELEAGPKSIKVDDITVVISKFDLQRGIADMLVGPATFSPLPQLVQMLERGDWSMLAKRAAGERRGKAPSAMSVAMDCASGITAGRKQRIADEASRTLLGDAINFPFPEVCAGMPVPDAGEAFRAPLRSSVPALLISGTLDGRTRPRQAEELRMTMPNAEHLVIVGAGHSDPLFLSSPKILEAMKAFLRGERLAERYITLPE